MQSNDLGSERICQNSVILRGICSLTKQKKRLLEVLFVLIIVFLQIMYFQSFLEAWEQVCHTAVCRTSVSVSNVHFN